MTVYFAIMAILGQLLTAYLIGYPICWAIEKVWEPVAELMSRLHHYWDSSYRD